ncbi:hypothetical protein PFLUV_G00199860 [Perca fluviatilis]|uniref:Coiled-coil domain-containing protein 106 n=2 Tax=Perca fluviatilis TaxID=8168 RepID=A0A6A5EMW4_PERFL|nr:hypothetical protein PFLUV_G00199860 [Perca fluviatilis]
MLSPRVEAADTRERNEDHVKPAQCLKKVSIMSDPVQTTSDSLSKLVRWAHSHGTICNLIPSLQRLTYASHGNVLTPEPVPRGSSDPVAVWSCGAGHAYHWPLSDHSNACGSSANTSQGQERVVVGRRPSDKGTAKPPCELFYGEAASEEEFSSQLFDIVGCDSSATDDDGDWEPPRSKKRGGAPGGAVTGKKIKQELTPAEDYGTAANIASMGVAVDLVCEGVVDPDMKLLGGGSCTTTETTERTAGEQTELEKLRALLYAERHRNQQMTEIISGLKQDKELLQQELTKKAELICDFMRPEKTWPGCSNPMEAGGSHMHSSDEAAGFDSSTMFDSFEEKELSLQDRRRTLKSKTSRDGENPRVRMKNVKGVIARYTAALQEYRRNVSMKVAFDRVGVDRNTISRTASIAELSLAAPEVFQLLAPWDEKEETLAHYAHRCRQAMDDNIKAKVKTMKAKGELLPIVSKIQIVTH